MLVIYDEEGKVTGTFNGDPSLLASDSSLYLKDTRTPSEIGELSDWRVQNGELVRVDLAGARRAALADAENEIAMVRRLYITDLPGQGMIYLDKEREAARYLSQDPAPSDLSEFPWIAREVGTTGSSAYEVAQVFVNMAAQWRIVGPAIEGIRLETKEAIETATDLNEINATITDMKLALDPYL